MHRNSTNDPQEATRYVRAIERFLLKYTFSKVKMSFAPEDLSIAPACRSIWLKSLCIAYTIGEAMFEWDRGNLRKIQAHKITQEDAEQSLVNGPILIYSHDVEGEPRFVYYGETNLGRILAVVVTERGHKIRVVTAYDLDAGQKRAYFKRRAKGE